MTLWGERGVGFHTKFIFCICANSKYSALLSLCPMRNCFHRLSEKTFSFFCSKELSSAHSLANKPAHPFNGKTFVWLIVQSSITESLQTLLFKLYIAALSYYKCFFRMRKKGIQSIYLTPISNSFIHSNHTSLLFKGLSGWDFFPCKISCFVCGWVFFFLLVW